ncbi:MAG: F0F1 ATP synthase subunit A [Planctomycetaceae bacterium]|jgi:F-type H+-transporting ATPase subunit a|nr:F0F1 ATP synthase subunit A [Planctomycetaceae bacterium]
MAGGINVNDLAGHVKDTDYFHFPWGHWHIPESLVNIGMTKFVLIEMAAAVLMLAVFIPMAGKLRGGMPAKGRFWNMIEVFLLYIKDQVIVPSIGSAKDAAPYVPYLWTLFFFVLFCNLGGMLPWMGSPTGSVTVTAVLALCTLTLVIATGIFRHGFSGFWLGMVPHIEGKVGPINLAAVLSPILFVLEVFSFFVKHFSLCIRLMANMFGGHLMLAVFLAFIPMAAWSVFCWIPVTLLSFAASVAISFLELFVAFLQAYIFTFLTSVYIGMSIHQH